MAGLLIGLVALAPAAFAHHSDITGSANCEKVVSWTATAWAGESGEGYENSRTNTDVDVWYTIGAGPKVPVANGAFNKANSYSFNGTFNWPATSSTTLTLWVQEQTKWANGVSPSSPRSWDVSLPTDCLGSLSISKVVTGNAAPPGATYTISYDNGSGTSGQVDIKGGETETIPNLPFGSYTLDEVNPPAGDSVSISPNPAIIAKKGDKVDVTVTNAFAELGGFTVTKHVTGETAGYVAGSTFSVAYACDNETSGSLSLKNGETKGVSGLPIGTTCSLNEAAKPATKDASYVYGSESFTPSSSVKIVQNSAQNTVGVTLENPITRVLGGFTVTKHVTGETAGYVAGSTFSVAYDCDNETSGSLSLKNGETKGVSGLPIGTTCSLNETAKPATSGPSYAYGPESFTPSSSVKIVQNSAQNVVAINLENPIVRLLGSLEVSKSISGDTDGYVADSTFGFNVDCDGTDHDQTLNLEAGGSATIDGIPLGTDCTVAEVSVPDPIDGYAYGTPTITPADGTVTISSTTAAATVAFDNPLVWLPKPGATVDNDCESGGAVVVLTNDGGGEVAFTITVDGVPFGSPVNVDSQSTKKVVVPLTEDQVATIEVSADGFGSITKTEITHNCQEPAAAIAVSCAEGGVVVTLTNDGPTPVDLTVTKDGQVVETVTVGTEPVDVLVPMTEDEQAKIEVLDGTTVVASLDATYDCEAPPTTVTPTTTVTPATAVTPTTPAVPTQVLGTTQTPSTLPVTGSDSFRLVFGALALIFGGGILLIIARRRRA